MIDIVGADSGGLEVYDTQVSKAANILSVQLGSLEYAPDLGIDLKYFLSEDLRFQNESFKAYLVERLANRGVNVTSVVETIENLFSEYTFNLSPPETTTGLIAR